MKRLRISSIILFLMILTFAGCQTGTGKTEKEFVINRGVNISHWLSQSSRRGAEREAFFTAEDVKFIKECGYDHIRLPVDEEQLWDENGVKDAEGFRLLHNALGWFAEFDLPCIVDLHIIRSHHFNNEIRPLWTDPAEQDKFIELWRQLSSEMKEYPLNMVAYELMNEAVADDPEDWNKLLARGLAAVRENEPERKVVIGSNRWQSASTFDQLKVPANDKNIILSFHFYSPFPLTHHQASWTDIKDYKGPVHYPGQLIDTTDLQGYPEELVKRLSWDNRYYTKDTLEVMMAKPIKLAAELGLTLYCGEWGALPTTAAEDRLRWYADMREVLERNNIAWANWDYKGGFGIRNGRTGEKFTDLTNVLLP